MIIITGASDGLGLQIAKLYHEAGVYVVNISRRSCEYADDNFLYDLSVQENIDKVTHDILAIKQPIDALVHCAGLLTLEKLGKITSTELDRVMKVNTNAPILLTSNLIDRIKKEGTDIVMISSSAAMYPYAGQAVYDASKWALRGFTNDLQLELKDSPSRVIGMYPDMLDTDMAFKIPGLSLPKSKHPAISSIALAMLVKMTLDLPKNMEVSEMIINRKVIK